MSVGCVAADPTLPVPLALAPLKLGDAIYNNQAIGITNSSSTTEIEQIENGEGDSLTHWRSTPIRQAQAGDLALAMATGEWRAGADGRTVLACSDGCSPARADRGDWRVASRLETSGRVLCLPADGEHGSQGGSRRP